MDDSRENSTSYQVFLDDFSTEDQDTEDFIQKKVISYSNFFTCEELEGECIGWSQDYLNFKGCPPVLSAFISRSVYAEISKQDIHSFVIEKEKEEYFDEIEDGEDNKKSAHSEDSPDDTIYDLRLFLKKMIDTIQSICNQWKKQLPQLTLNKSLHEVCVHAIKNTRRKMEDTHVICSDLNSLFSLEEGSNYSFYSIFDGHGGPEAAMYAANHLHTNLIHQHNFSSNPACALQQAYKQTDKAFLHKAKKENLKSGTTGVSVLTQGSKLYIAWLGDSQAVMVKNGQFLSVMEPHKPDRKDEKERIEGLGGIVVWYGAWRVNGSIAVARAIGDKDYKPFVSSDADVYSHSLDGSEEYIVLACDGLWDVIPPQEIPDLVYDHVKKHNGDRTLTAKTIVEMAKEKGSTDNISVIVVFLRDEISQPKSSN